MKKDISIVICSRQPTQEKQEVVKNIKETCGCNEHIFFIHNPAGAGLSEVYNNMLQSGNLDSDIVVFMHDDVEFLKKGWGKELVDLFEKHQDYGIIGVAGSAQFDTNGVWWQYDKKYGQVLHRHEGKSWLTSFSPLLNNDLQEVCVIDGLFIAVNTKRINALFDTDFTFDFYDISFCLDNYLGGKTKIGVTTNIRLAHNSIGQMREGWYVAREKAIEKYKNNLPIDVEKDGKKK